MKITKSDKDLISLLQKDDRIAFYHIYERYSKRIFGFSLKYLKQESDAEEIVQMVFVKIWESRKKINSDSSFESFLFTITYNTIISILRKRSHEKKYQDYLMSMLQINNSPDLIDEIHFNELNNKVQSLLNKLTPRQQEIYRLSREEGLSHDEIAKRLDISVNTVKKHMTNTLSFLKPHFDNRLVMCVLFAYLFF